MKLSFRRSLLPVLGILPMLFVVACGGTPQASTSSSSAQAVVSTQTAKPASIQKTSEHHGIQMNNTQNTQGKRQALATPTAMNNQSSHQTNRNQSNLNTQNKSQVPPATTNTLISVKQVNVHGQIETVLTTFTGMTLYERTSDRAPGSSCTGQCARIWPPLLSNGTVISTAPIGGTLTVHLTMNGKQVEFNGHPLYTYSSDTAPGQTNGQGVGNAWQIIPIALQPQHW